MNSVASPPYSRISIMLCRIGLKVIMLAMLKTVAITADGCGGIMVLNVMFRHSAVAIVYHAFHRIVSFVRNSMKMSAVPMIMLVIIRASVAVGVVVGLSIGMLKKSGRFFSW